jgi:Tfp pilus assembly protein PilV
MSCIIPSQPYDITLTLNTAPSWPFTAEDDSVSPIVALDLTGASIWMAIKASPTTSDANAAIFASTANSKIAITDAEAGQFQVDLTTADTAESASLLPNARYFAFIKILLASGESRVRTGWVETLYEGVEAP